MVDTMANKNSEMGIADELDRLDNKMQDSIDCELIAPIINQNQKILNIIHFNIRSIHKNFDNLIAFLQAYNLSFCDIIILSECWAVDDVDLYNINKFSKNYDHGNLNKNDGTIIYIRQTVNASYDSIKLKRSGATISKINFSINNISYEVTCGYRPPSSSTQCFIEDLNEYFLNKSNNQVEMFIGDINIDILKKADTEVNMYLSLLNVHGYSSAINGPTRVTSNSSSCLDHIFVRNKLKAGYFRYDTYILNTDLTDHFPVMINFYGREVHKNPVQNHNRLLSKTIVTLNYQTLTNLMSQENWTNVLGSKDTEVATNTFSKTISSYIEQSKEYKLIHYREHNKLKPWITNSIIESIRRRDKIKKKYLLTKDPSDLSTYKIYRNSLNKIINKQKHNFYKQQIEANQNNFKKLYKILNEAVDGVNIANDSLEIKNDNNEPFNSKKDMANHCNSFFANIGLEMLKKIKDPIEEFQIQCNTLSSMFLKPVHENDIVMHIKSLKNNCAPGPDGIGSKLIKYLHIYLTKPLTHIINLIFKTATVPSSFKTSIITPIYKSGDKTKITNYRPISVINNFAKIFEKCLKDKLYHFLKSNNILSPRQFGFCDGLSTSDAIYHLTNNITNNLDNGNKCIAVFLDLAKAFDTVPHGSLLGVLQAYGVRGTVLDVFASYLHGREQVVKLHDFYSDPLPVRIGIPQGTVLGPLLFIAYINSMTSIDVENGLVVSYADDTAIVFTGETWEQVKSHTIKGISKIKNWLDSFKLTLNISKTNYIAFSLTAANRPDFNNIIINGINEQINEVPFTKYLGVIIDNNLKWKHHIERLSGNIRKLIRRFYTLREILNAKLLICVYRAVVESLIRYGIVVWGGLYNTTLRQLQVAQNYILKVTFRRNRRYPTQLLYNKEILSVRSLYLLCTCSFIHQKPHLKDYINHTYATRQNTGGHLKIPNSKTNINLRFLTYLMPKIYNALPAEIKSISNLKKFNNHCKNYVLENLHIFERIF